MRLTATFEPDFAHDGKVDRCESVTVEIDPDDGDG